MLKVSKEELISAITGEGVVDRLWARIQRIRSHKHQTVIAETKK